MPANICLWHADYSPFCREKLFVTHTGRTRTHEGMIYISGGFQLPLCPVFLGLSLCFIRKHFVWAKPGDLQTHYPHCAVELLGMEWRNKQVALTSQRLQTSKPVEMNTVNWCRWIVQCMWYGRENPTQEGGGTAMKDNKTTLLIQLSHFYVL